MTFPYYRHPTLRPGDIAVALQLVLIPGAPYDLLASSARVSLGHSHNAVKRLALARLADPHTRTVSRNALLEFLVHGAARAFPAVRLCPTSGVPVVHSHLPPPRAPAPPTADLVWPWHGGETTGPGLMPLYPGAPRTRLFNRRLYHLLSLVDTLRAGTPPQHEQAKELLTSLLTGVPASEPPGRPPYFRSRALAVAAE
ncbi:MAG: hypothetical protein ACREON_11085 [Gemmatimonadaceae bacterium]